MEGIEAILPFNIKNEKKKKNKNINKNKGLALVLTSAGPDKRQEGEGSPDGTKQVDVKHVLEVLDRAPLNLSPV